MKSAVVLRRSRRTIPLILLGAEAYIDYAAGYVIAWKEIYLRHSAAAAIVFWVLLGLFQILHLFYWVMIFVRGPGNLPQFQHFDLYGVKSEDSAPVPAVFVSDEQGFPFWCSKCQNLKPDRSFHSTDLDACVPRFDHFCLWIGTAIGRDNFLSFVKFLQALCAYAILVLTFVAVYTRSTLHGQHSKLPHFIVLFILNGFIFVFTVALLIGTVKNTFSNSTSFDEITVRQARSHKRWVHKKENMNPKYAWCVGRMPRVEPGVRYVNIAHGNTRKVVAYQVTDHPYSNGFRANLINTCLNGNYNVNSTRKSAGVAALVKAGIVALVPLAEFLVATSPGRDAPEAFDKHSDEMSPAFLRMILDKIDQNQFQYASYVSPSVHTTVAT